MDIPRSIPYLCKGWQAQLRMLQRDGRSLQVVKTYGIGLGWNESYVYDILNAMINYHEWMQKNNIHVAPTICKGLAKSANGWTLSIQQPYLGPDCERILTIFNRHNQTNNSKIIFRKLLKLAVKLAWNPAPPTLRCEVKPRDFCLDKKDAPVLIDTFPPVLARLQDRIVVANRRLTGTCLTDRDREEVLEVTGSTTGILRNFCEHMMAIIPHASTLWMRETVDMAISLDQKLGEKLVKRLMGSESRQKIKTLSMRRRQRVKLL
jgi:hypothetical protein